MYRAFWLLSPPPSPLSLPPIPVNNSLIPPSLSTPFPRFTHVSCLFVTDLVYAGPSMWQLTWNYPLEPNGVIRGYMIPLSLNLQAANSFPWAVEMPEPRLYEKPHLEVFVVVLFRRLSFPVSALWLFSDWLKQWFSPWGSHSLWVLNNSFTGVT